MEQMFLEDFNFIERYELFEDEQKGNKKFFLRGIFSRVDHPNKNKRIYTRNVMEEAINSINDTITNRGLVGQLDHPSSPKIDVKGISHVITNLTIANDGAVIGEAEVLNTEPGKTLKELMKANVKLGVSTRGIGSVEAYNGPLVKEGTGFVNVKSGYKIKAIDVVFDPSQESFPSYVREELENHTSSIILGATKKFSKIWEDAFEI